MQRRIEAFDSLTGWSINSPSTVFLNTFPSLVATLRNTVSLAATFDRADTVRTLTKTFAPVDVSDYQFFVFHMWSENKGKQEYLRSVEAEFDYKIRLNDTAEYFIPLKTTFTDININIEDITTIDRIEITALHSNTDTIVLSEGVVEFEQMPEDLLDEVQFHLEYYLNRNLGNGVLLGTINTTAGDTTIDTSGYPHLDRFAVFLITDGTNSERHQIAEVNDVSNVATLTDNFDGTSITNTFSGAQIYVTFPVYINPDETVVRLPGISLWGITPESVLRTGKLDRFIEAYKTNGEVVERIEGHIWFYTILMNSESRSAGLLSSMTKAIRDFIANELIWVNGRKHELYFETIPTENRPQSGVDIIPSVQYQASVEVIELINPADTLARTTTINTEINIGDRDA